MLVNLENSAVATGLENFSFHSNPKKGNAKECWNYCTIALISHASKIMLKILQARLQQYMNGELQDVQAGFRKSRETRGQIAYTHWITEKAREFQKNIYFCFIDYAKAFDCVDHNKLIRTGLVSDSQDQKRSVFIPITKKGKAKECSDYCTIALISHASKIMLKILQARLQQYVNWELPDVQTGFRIGRGTRDQIANICWIIEKAREFQKNIYFCFIDCAKTFDCVNYKKLKNS